MQTFTSSLQYLEARFSTGVRYIGSLLFTVTYVSNAVWVLAVIPYKDGEYFIYFVTIFFSFLDGSTAMGLSSRVNRSGKNFARPNRFNESERQWEKGEIREVHDNWKSFFSFLLWFRFFTYVSFFTSHHTPLIQVRYKLGVGLRQMHDFFHFII